MKSLKQVNESVDTGWKMIRLLVRLRERHRLEEGFSLIEMMVAMLVLSVGIAALSQLGVYTLTNTLKTRQREAAVAEVSRQIEAIRSQGYNNIQLRPGTTPAPPTTFTDDDGITYNTLIAPAGTCSSCLTYQTSTTVNGATYTVQTIVIGVDDPADGIGAADADQVLVDYKKAIVQISSTTGAAYTYKAETIIHDTSKDPVVVPIGLQILIWDGTANAQVTDQALDWTIDITGTGILGQTIDEGSYTNLTLPTGSYTCTLSNTPSTRDWHPNGSSSADSESFACNVVNNTITVLTRTWIQTDVCPTGQTGDLTVQVINSTDGSLITTASVDPSPQNGQSNPASQVTGADGQAFFTAIGTGYYALAVTASGFTSVSGLVTCVTGTQGNPVVVALNPTSPITTATVEVRVKWTAGGTKTFVVTLNSNLVVQQDISHNAIAVFRFTPPPGTYDVKVYCINKTNQNLRESVLAQAFASGRIYYFPGPDTTVSYQENKC